MILAIVGPTGVGKTKLSVSLAKYYDAIIINCDAMQIYKDMNIGTAKVTEEEKENVDHFLLDRCSLNEEYSVYDYQQDARALLEKYKDRNIILVGGTGLYLKALLYDYKFQEPSEEDFEKYTNEELYQMVSKQNPDSDIHVNNRRRLISYLKIPKTTNSNNKLYDALIIWLTTNRDNLYNIINNRVDKMMDSGLEEEARDLFNKYPTSRALNTAIGYKELNSYFKNEISKEEAIELIKKNSRHYAKRQYTFFNNQLDVKWFNTDYDCFNNTINDVKEYIDNTLSTAKK